MEPLRKHEETPVYSTSPATSVAPQQSNVFAGAAWMVGISLLLFFLPAVNGLIGGLVGGYKVGSVGRAVVAAIIPALIIAVGLWGLLALANLPVIGFVAGTTIGVIIAIADLSLFIGAVIGGFLGSRKTALR